MKSQAQRGAMYAAKAGKSTLGIPKSVGAEFVKSDTGGKLPKRMEEGGAVKSDRDTSPPPFSGKDQSRYGGPEGPTRHWEMGSNEFTYRVLREPKDDIKPNAPSTRNYAKGGTVRR
jgi:hypothetical protein